ncbi:MAG: hypothetical protein RLY17_266 [Pseudomonadota bacterium]
MLSSTFVRSNAGFVSLVLAVLILAACSGKAPQTPTPANIQGEASANSDYYLQQLQQSGDNNKADWQLLAIRALLHERKIPHAAEQLATLPANLNDTQRQEQQLLTAELLIAQKNTPAATDVLSKLDTSKLSENQQIRFYKAQITAHQGKATLPLIRAFIAQEPLLKDKAHQDNIDGTWQSLAQLTQQELNNIVINADENVLQGWLDLLRVYQDNKQDPDMLKAGIKDWQNRYPQNPAAKTLPTAFTQINNFRQASTTKIALLLPLRGPAKAFADAIQQGFSAAQNGLPVAAPAPIAPETTTAAPVDTTIAADDETPVNLPIPVATSNAQVKVYDTTTQPIATLLAQAQQDGATLVVGPLLKPDVEQLSTTPSTLNILALNQPEVSKNNPNICYFALSPEDEARDAAHHLWHQEKRMPLLLTPRSAFGDRIAKAFAEEWQKQGGQTVLQQKFGSIAELKQAINSGAGIRLTGQPVDVPSTPAAAPASVTIAGLTIPAPPVDPTVVSTSIGGNIDAVYIIATPAELTLIKPMIDMATTTRSKPSLFASSRSYQAGAGPDYRLEMEGVQFSDIPLMAGSNPALMLQASAKYANDYSLVRLYAMGIDAWTLSNHFAQMRQIPGFQISGITGDLTASEDCVINRKLPWLQYRQGMVVPAT